MEKIITASAQASFSIGCGSMIRPTASRPSRAAETRTRAAWTKLEKASALPCP
jgi:hypothetical protein